MNEASQVEKNRLNEIEMKLAKLKHTYDGFVPVYYTIDRKMKSLKHDINILEDEKVKMLQGQIMFDDGF